MCRVTHPLTCLRMLRQISLVTSPTRRPCPSRVVGTRRTLSFRVRVGTRHQMCRIMPLPTSLRMLSQPFRSMTTSPTHRRCPSRGVGIHRMCRIMRPPTSLRMLCQPFQSMTAIPTHRRCPSRGVGTHRNPSFRVRVGTRRRMCRVTHPQIYRRMLRQTFPSMKTTPTRRPCPSPVVGTHRTLSFRVRVGTRRRMCRITPLPTSLRMRLRRFPPMKTTPTRRPCPSLDVGIRRIPSFRVRVGMRRRMFCSKTGTILLRFR